MDPSKEEVLRDIRDAPEVIRSAVYGGVSGGRLGVAEFEVFDGLILRQTFAHVMSPYLMAFVEPDPPSNPHPGPWRAVSGGNHFDVHIEIALAERASPANFDRINTIWWTLSLLRIITGVPLVLPVLSDTPFAEARCCEHVPQFWPVEMSHPRFGPEVADVVIGSESLRSVRTLFSPGAALMEIEHFNRAYQTMDSASLAHSSGAGMVMMWAALETLFRPGQHQITKRLSKSIATHIEEPGGRREALQQDVAKLYELRGTSVHNSEAATEAALVQTASLARRAFILCMERGAIPDCDALLLRWSAEHPKNQSA